MLVEFDKLPDSSKIWIYQSDRKFYPEELPEIVEKTTLFLKGWTNKDKPIEASFLMRYDRFIIIGANDKENPLSIEAIDSSVGLIIDLQGTYKIELLDKLNVCFKQGEFVQYKDLKSFQKLIKNKSISAKTIVFNNLINTKEELEDNWEIPITESWHNRFL